MLTKYRGQSQRCFTISIVRSSFFVSVLFLVAFVSQATTKHFQIQTINSIGQIQGSDQVSPYVGDQVAFHGIVTGLREEVNQKGIHYYTLFVQDLPGQSDDDTSTSNGIGVFVGRNFPSAVAGDLVAVQGKVTEYFGFTEIDDDGLVISITDHDPDKIPEPVFLDPPPDLVESAIYFERLESMLVALSEGYAVSPTHIGCGFAVVKERPETHHVYQHHPKDPTGHVVNVLNWTDANCDTFPEIVTGDRVRNLKGPLIYHFDTFKIVQQDPKQFVVERGTDAAQCSLPLPTDDQIGVASLNLNDYFDSVSDTGLDSEPVISTESLDIKQSKIVNVIAGSLNCPDVLALQEVENAELLATLSEMLVDRCSIKYVVNHIASPDLRGADVALMINPDKIKVLDTKSRQVCTEYVTDVNDPSVTCDQETYPLFSRPPLQVDLEIHDEIVTVLVNHFKSKRGGEIETEPWRIAQSREILNIVSNIRESTNPHEIIVLGDFNDYAGSETNKILTGSGALIDGLAKIQEADRYSYIFDGKSQLIDWILLTPNIYEQEVSANICHVNADYPFQWASSSEVSVDHYQSSDHDFPFILIDLTKDDSEVVVDEKPATEVPATIRSLPDTPRPTVRSSPRPATPESIAVYSTAQPAPTSQKSISDHSGLADTGQSLSQNLSIGSLILMGILVLILGWLILRVNNKRKGE